MKVRLACLALGLLGVAAGEVLAQPGLTVQLPTRKSFSVGTTVSVPDRGQVLLGGINRSSTGRNEFGVPMLGKVPYLNRLFNNRSIGGSLSSSNVHATVFIHDFEAMEEDLLSRPTSTRRLSSLGPRRPRSSAIAGGLQPRNPALGVSWKLSSPASSPDRPTMSLADAQARRTRRQAERAEEALEFFQRGQQAEAAGKANVARIYYQMVARRASGQLKQRVLAKLDAIGREQTGSRVVQGNP